MMTAQLLLTMDTSSPQLTMGLYQLEEGKAFESLAETTINSDSQRYHSAILLPELSKLFLQANKAIQDLSAMAVHIGPGSFTGIRTGLISARTMGQFLPIQTYAINAFELGLFTASKNYPDKPVCIAIDARRGRTYMACGQYGDHGFIWEQTPILCDVDTIIERYSNVTFIGSDSLSPHLPLTKTLESLSQEDPASRQMAALIQSQPQLFKRPWQALIPLYLEEPNITLPKRNPAIIQAKLS